MDTDHNEKTEVNPGNIELTSRLFNTLKMRERLLTADAMLRPIAQLWLLFMVCVGGPYAYEPTQFSIQYGLLYSGIVFLAYYVLIGSIRRNTETYLEKLAAAYGYDLRKGSLRRLQEKLDAEKPFKDQDDPPLVRFLFEVARRLHLPRRGLIQQTVVVSQLVFLVYYAFNYAYYWSVNAPAYFPERLWMLHGAVTLFGFGMMFKNASFLINSKYFLAIARGILDIKDTAKKAIGGLAQAGSDSPCDPPPDKQ